jgi:hypothetical protein
MHNDLATVESERKCYNDVQNFLSCYYRKKSCLIVFCLLEILETNTQLVKVTLLLLTNEYKIFTTHIVKVTLIIMPSKHVTSWPQNSIPQ